MTKKLIPSEKIRFAKQIPHNQKTYKRVGRKDGMKGASKDWIIGKASLNRPETFRQQHATIMIT